VVLIKLDVFMQKNGIRPKLSTTHTQKLKTDNESKYKT
jgi:hypothetical protein